MEGEVLVYYLNLIMYENRPIFFHAFHKWRSVSRFLSASLSYFAQIPQKHQDIVFQTSINTLCSKALAY